jgi:hypothetical protein
LPACAICWMVIACSPPDALPAGTPPASTADTTVDSATEPTLSPECEGAAEIEALERHFVLVFEDFDFLPDGRVVTGANGILLVYTDWGATQDQIGFGLGANPTGVRALASGHVAVADVSTGDLSLVDLATGGTVRVLSGLRNPNGLAAAHDGTIYLSEHVPGGRILHVDPASGDFDIAFTASGADAPNGLALDLDDALLYVAYEHRIDRIDLADGTASVVYTDDDDRFDSVAVDSCGSVYTIGYSLGTLRRIAPDGTVEEVAVMTEGGAFSSLRWGLGTDALPRDHLYIGAQHNWVTEVAVGRPGVSLF